MLPAIIAMTQVSFAQNVKKPSALLVMLNSEQNRIKFAQDHNRSRELEEIRRDAANAAAATKNDFRDHFNYCPVYYFMDSNISKIKAHNFEGIVTKADGTAAIDIPHNFIVAYYGFCPAPVSEDQRLRKGIVIADQNMQQLYFRSQSSINISFHKRDKKLYLYTSKHYDIDYKAIAEEVQTLIAKKYK